MFLVRKRFNTQQSRVYEADYSVDCHHFIFLNSIYLTIFKQHQYSITFLYLLKWHFLLYIHKIIVQSFNFTLHKTLHCAVIIWIKFWWRVRFGTRFWFPAFIRNVLIIITISIIFIIAVIIITWIITFTRN